MPKWFIYIFFKTKCCVIANVVKQNKNEKAKIEKSFCNKIEKSKTINKTSLFLTNEKKAKFYIDDNYDPERESDIYSFLAQSKLYSK